jgi:hypothetical protein
MFKSKLPTTYPEADPGKHLKGDWQGIDPVLAGRLAHHAKVNKAAYTITSGYRSYEEQVKLYADYKAGKLQATAAVPGTSWHGSRLAVDTSTYPIRGATSAQLAMYGLCKPLKNEPWHIQPIETAKMGAKCNLSLAPEEVKEEDDDMKTYESINELTGDWKEAVEWAVKVKILSGTGKGLGLRESEVKALVFQYRDNKRKGTL